MSVDVVKLAQRVDAHVEQLRGGHDYHHDGLADDHDHGSADHHDDDGGRLRAALDDDDLDDDHKQHDDDDSRARLPVQLPGVLRLGRWRLYSHDVRGRRTDAINPVHNDDEQHDHDHAVMRLRDNHHEHDNSSARLHGRLHVGGSAAAERVRHVGLGEEDRPVRLRVPVPTANDERLLQHGLNAVRDDNDDHNARAVVLGHVRLLVGSGACKVDFPQLDVQPGLSRVSVHSAICAGRPVPGDHGSVCGARDADDYHHDHGRPVLAVLHHDDDERHDDDGPAMRVGILRVGLAAVAGAVVATRVLVPVELPVRDT